MKITADSLLRGLARRAEAVAPAVAARLQAEAGAVAAAARGTGRYADQSGAMRAGTTAYVVGGGLDGSGAALARAMAEVAALNPGQEASAAGPAAGGDVILVLTSPVQYLEDVVTRQGGRQDWVSDTILSQADALRDAAARAAGGAWEG
jgi:hypothetical protein